MDQITRNNENMALEIVEGLVIPDYPANFQPTYPERDLLVAAVAELLTTTPVTTFEQIDELKDNLANVGATHGHSCVQIAGSCHEQIKMREPAFDIELLIEPTLIEHGIIRHVDPNALHIARTAGQSVKPRSSEFEVINEDELILSFFGEGVNGAGNSQRKPDPLRMVAMALQARDISAGLRDTLGEHLPLAHEMLLLAYEMAFVRTDEQTGKKYLLSADLPWIGVRTNDPDGPHVELLSQVENSIGIKIGSDSDALHIQKLAQKLNPNLEPGKLVFMLRVGNDVKKNLEILNAIKSHAAGSVVMYDIHGVTRSHESGAKIRCVEEVIKQITILQALCKTTGLLFGGNHLETTTEDRYECVDTPDELPKHGGNVDPRLNSRQLLRVLTEANQS